MEKEKLIMMNKMPVIIFHSIGEQLLTFFVIFVLSNREK